MFSFLSNIIYSNYFFLITLTFFLYFFTYIGLIMYSNQIKEINDSLYPTTLTFNFFNVLPTKKIIVNYYIYKLSLYFSIFLYFLHVFLFIFFKTSVPFVKCTNFNLVGYTFDFVLDELSAIFLLLTSFLITICLFLHVYWPINTFLNINKYEKILKKSSIFFFENFLNKAKFFFFYIFFLYIILIFFFTTYNFLIFYITFELSMIPLFFIIGSFGTRIHKIKATYYIFLYTIFGSIFFFLGLLLLYNYTGSFNFQVLQVIHFNNNLQIIFWILFLIPFSIKIPIIPFHIWLPEAHVEAPTEGSVLLAGLLLKVGVFGIIKFLIPLFPYGFSFFTPIIYTISLVSLFYTSLLIFVQNDIKKIIAYSSIAHMNFAMLGLFSQSLEGYLGSIFTFYTHGIISSGLFICIGFIYIRYHTRLLNYYNGLTIYFPLIASSFFLFTLGNMSFPGTGSFPGELLIILGIFSDNIFVAFFSLLGTFFSTLYSIVLFTKLFFGNPFFYKNKIGKTIKKEKLFYIEYIILCTLVILLFLTGFLPGIFLKNLIK